MESLKTINKSNQNSSASHTDVSDIIYYLLNEGSLFSICRIMENLKLNDEKRYIINAFKEKYDFDFLNYVDFTIS